uniref:Glutathione-dependent formaldehyde-activating enzyme n=1 Tax=Mycena chlorophos TaxID=658473 RepID=A0ABQ0L5U5_MYCCL|nr:glutathione-dependent formaldehyde-activating enzyme [Mycena chlorophos]
MTDLVEYQGNCHCGAFKFSFQSPKIKEAGPCDCSICARNDYLWTKPTEFKVTKGDENTTLTQYNFGSGNFTHKFCPTCGTSVMCRAGPAIGGGFVILNLRCVQGIDFASLKIKDHFKGSAHGKPYQAPEPVAVELAPEGATLYHGNCHCGAIAFTLVSNGKITETTLTECNCSICWRDGSLWTYPLTKEITFRGLESATEYTFALKVTYHGFCKICGVSMFERFTGQEDGKERSEWTALNVRTFNELNLKELKLEQSDGLSDLPLYQVPE